MAKTLLLEEFHVSFYVTRGLTDAEYRTARRALNARSFRDDLRRQLKSIVGASPALRNVTFGLSR